MNHSRAFRISNYLPLSIATVALGIAEATFLPEVGVFAVVVLIAFAVIYRLETVMRPLTAGESNRLGACIAVAAILWAGFRIVREANTGEFASLGWVAFLVALVAPILLALVCALLLRSEKKPGDYWYMQVAGLATIVLAGAMAEHTVMVALTAAYALSEVWFLTRFFRARLPARGTERLQLPRAALWFALALGCAVPLYLLTPRSPFEKLEFGSSRIEIGYAADQMIDLTQTGELRDNPETAFEVQAENRNGQPKEDLDPNQRWRGAVLLTYSGGTWRRDTQTVFPTEPATVYHPGPWEPDLGPQEFRLTFTVPAKLRSKFLLDPVQWKAGDTVPVADWPKNGPAQPWIPLANGRVFGRADPARSDEREFHYVQNTRPPDEPDLSPAYYGASSVNRAFVVNPLPSLKDYTDRVLDTLAAQGKLPPAAVVRDAVRLLPSPRYHEAIARALRDYLSESSDLAYTTNLKRVNRSVDPVEDFLFHSKAGHCERFATALVLMLRSQEIPAVLVLGFKGCEHVGGGKYVVRQEFAHAWAEALITRQDPGNRRVALHWLSLDPSPNQDRSADSAASSSNRNWAAFERFIFSNSREERERVLRGLAQFVSSSEFLLGLACATGAALALRFAWRRRRARSQALETTAWFQRLLDALAPHGLVPDPGETAQEFATRASALLPVPTADIPEKWVELHYRERFGGAAVDAQERTELEHRLLELARPPETRL